MDLPLSKAAKGIDTDKIQQPIPENVAAIDFGTTSLTLSYGTRGRSHVNTPKLDQNSDYRIPNAILLERGEGNAIVSARLGRSAKDTYKGLRHSDRKNYIYFERIKMLLKRNDKALDREAHVESFDGKIFYLIEVISFILKYVAIELQEHLTDTRIPLTKCDFHWVITVPAIWDVKGKRLMREAAFLSGILTSGEGIKQLTPWPNGAGMKCPDEINTEKLSLALEPECAAIYSQMESRIEIKDHSSTISKAEAKEYAAQLSKEYMVIDAGGGTIDITIQLEGKKGVEVISIPDGNDMGGVTINEKFSKIFQDIVGDPGFAKFQNGSDKADAISKKLICNQLIYTEFEFQKISICNEKVKEASISVPMEMVVFYTEEKIINGIASYEGFSFEYDAIYISKKAFIEVLLQPSLDKLIESAKNALEKSQGNSVATIYLVGGFGSSPIVRNRLDNDVKGMNIVLPRSPLLAIATGAVMWRRNPDVIKSRRSDATYGIAIMLPFDHKKHKPAYKVKNDSDGKYYCKDVFEVFLLKGDRVSLDEVFTSDLAVPSNDAEVVSLTLYSTKKDGVQYVTEPDGHSQLDTVGRLLVETPNPDKLPLHKRRIEVTISFSGTEITAKAKYSVTKREVKTVCDFLSAVSNPSY